MFWKVELDKEGNVKSCDPVEQISKSGNRVTFIEAETKADACDLAKQWYEKRRKRWSDLSAKRERDGKCKSCGVRTPEPGYKNCRPCLDQRKKDMRGYRDGTKIGAPRKSAHQLMLETQQADRERGRMRVTLMLVLRNFDLLGPSKFREWLTDQIESRAAISKDHLEQKVEKAG